MEKTDQDNFVAVRAMLPTIPLPPSHERPTLTTEHLLIRPLAPNDLEAMHVLQTQEEVMRCTTSGRIDKDLEETKTKLDKWLPPNDLSTFNYALCLKETGEFIGLGGCHSYSGRRGWPEVGYMIRKEFWGKGLATEFLRCWLCSWMQLPRSEQEVRVQREMVKGEGLVQESIIAITTAENVPSQNVLSKCGFERFREFTEPDNRNPDVGIQLVAYRYPPGNAEDC